MYMYYSPNILQPPAYAEDELLQDGKVSHVPMDYDVPGERLLQVSYYYTLLFFIVCTTIEKLFSWSFD